MLTLIIVFIIIIGGIIISVISGPKAIIFFVTLNLTIPLIVLIYIKFVSVVMVLL